MPEVSIYIRTHNDKTCIEEAIVSVLNQISVDFEVLIVDDGSDDNTFEIIKSFKDPRIKIIKNNKYMGHSFCNNLIIKKSNSPYIVFTESNYILLNKAVSRMSEKINSSNNIGLVHSHNIIADKNGNITRDAFHRSFRDMGYFTRKEMDYINEILYKGLELDGLRIYRKDAFDKIGMFDETIKYVENYDISLRILDKFEIAFLPELVYYVRKKNNYEFNRIKSIIKLPYKIYVTNKLIKRDELSYLIKQNYKPFKIVINTLYKLFYLKNIIDIIDKSVFKTLEYVSRKAIIPFSNRIYKFIASHFHWWPIDLFTFKNGDNNKDYKRIAYFIWQFPVLSQTFIQREIAALKSAGHSVLVISEIQADDHFLEEYEDTLESSTQYLDSLDNSILSNYKKYFFFKNPLLFISLFLYIVFHNYHSLKTFNNDKKKFYKGVLLAGFAKDKNINHIHSPWADNCALVSLIASKLLGISYSLHARAHEIHRKSYLFGLQEKFNNADFIITNTQYNVSHIKTFLNHSNSQKISLIYNGLNLDNFKPGNTREKSTKPIKILSVARLIEQKGLIYLLKALRILKDKNYKFECKIIGGSEDIFINYLLKLKYLHRNFGLDDCVFFLGSQPFKNVLEEYQITDIFVLPCVIAEDGSRDITPNSLIEAMAMKLAVISTNITGIPEIVENGVSGILIPPNDEVKLAEAMIELIGNDNLRKRLGINARKRVENRFDINKNVGQFIELFDGTN